MPSSYILRMVSFRNSISCLGVCHMISAVVVLVVVVVVVVGGGGVADNLNWSSSLWLSCIRVSMICVCVHVQEQQRNQ